MSQEQSSPRRLPQIPGYWIMDSLGQTSDSLIYEAVDMQKGDLVAIKEFLLKPEGSSEFLTETSSLLTLHHPNVITCRNLVYGREGHHYLILDYADGGSLRNLLQQKVTLAVNEALQITRQITLGLIATHNAGLVHRDLKPENILLQTVDGEIHYKIADLGISASLFSRSVSNSSGTPAYMSPEQFYDRASPQSDLYSLGVILFEMITGHCPYEGEALELFHAHLQGEIPWDWIEDREIRQFLIELLAIAPEDRPRTATRVLEKIDHLLGNPPKLGTPLPRETLTPRPETPRANLGSVWHHLQFNHLVKMIGTETPEGPALLLSDGQRTDCLLLQPRRLILGWHDQAITSVCSLKHQPGSQLLAAGREVWTMNSVQQVMPLFKGTLKIAALAVSLNENQLLCADHQMLQCLDSRGGLLWNLACDNYLGDAHILPLEDGSWVVSVGPVNPSILILSSEGKLLENHPLPAPILALLPGREKVEFQVITMALGGSDEGQMHFFGRLIKQAPLNLGQGLERVAIHRDFSTLIFNDGPPRLCNLDGRIRDDLLPSWNCDFICHFPESGYLAVASPVDGVHGVVIFAPSKNVKQRTEYTQPIILCGP